MAPFDNNVFESVIGLEVHAQLLTQSKIFCGCSTRFGDQPNSHTCPVCLGMPGVLPVINRKVVEFAIMTSLALHCEEIPPRSIFARKNYFYTDLPKGYQISQYESPLALRGCLEIPAGENRLRKIGITRIHLEEDAGKLVHGEGTESGSSFVDLNRAGVPLMEIVSEPDLRTPEEAGDYLRRLAAILVYLGVCDGKMEEGSLRCDANVSIRRRGETALGVKTELKNMNSFKNVEKALAKEIERQIELVSEGKKVIQETLLWDPDNEVTLPMRSKEEA
ncbi:MAG: Asp-tRNA(Asn)/Glu-tRNA(Gln) amidotransferase subunit GatB, partial [Proteobacteria bacterium]|nr:Asp-tRNA(Asn)/Glu-tRNA(Gln) amidotransferase subunit GatB [Pseudomonadota bacterium]